VHLGIAPTLTDVRALKAKLSQLAGLTSDEKRAEPTGQTEH
jgi:hypothetical protein